MNRHELHRALAEAGVPEGYYRIENVHEPTPPPVDFLALRRRGDSWETGAYERGTYTVIARFRSEPEACDHLYHLLT